MALMGIREYGRHRGLSHVAVLKAVRCGRIRRTADGQIDSDQADRDWARNTHPAPRAPHAVPVAAADDGGFSAARTFRAVYEARLARLEYEQKAATLLPADEVKIARFRIDRMFREHMLAIPDTVIARLRSYIREHGAAPDEHAVHVILADAVRTSLSAYADALEGGTAWAVGEL